MTPSSLRLELLALPKAVPELRAVLRERYGGEGCPDLQLCVSELLTNVIVHVGEGTPVTLHVSDTADGRTRVEVTDPDPRVWPVLREATGACESGRGLALLEAVSTRWGVVQGPGGKTVWCELPGSRLAGVCP